MGKLMDIKDEAGVREALEKKIASVTDGEWKYLKARNHISDFLNTWATKDEEERDQVLQDMEEVVRLGRQHLAGGESSSAKPRGRKGAPPPTYKPSKYESERINVLKHHSEISLSRLPEVQHFWAQLPEKKPLPLGDAGKFLVNPINGLMQVWEAECGGVSPAADMADVRLLGYKLENEPVNDGKSARELVPWYEFEVTVPSKGQQTSYKKPLSTEMSLAAFPSTYYAQVIDQKSSTSYWDFFQHHTHKEALFPEGPVRALSQRIPYLFSGSVIGQCLLIASRLAAALDRDVRDLVMFLLTSELLTPPVLTISCQETLSFDRDFCFSDTPTCGAIRITAQPWLTSQSVERLFAQYQSKLRGGADMRPAENMEVFFFVNNFAKRHPEIALRKNGGMNWPNVFAEWKTSEVSRRLNVKTGASELIYEAPAGLRRAYMDVKNSLIPKMAEIEEADFQ